MNDADGGNVGIGTAAPSSLLHVRSPSSNSIVNVQSEASNSYAGLQLLNDSGNAGLAISSYGSTYAGGVYDRANGVSLHTTSSAGASGGIAIAARNTSGYITFHSGGNSERLRIDAAGNVGIGTTTPDSKLAVNGTIHCKEVKVDLTNWPDYVFDKGYQLQPLLEVIQFIEQNGHLPEIPSAEVVEEQGLHLGEMNALLLKKVEELTLHLIRQQEEIEALKTRLKN